MGDIVEAWLIGNLAAGNVHLMLNWFDVCSSSHSIPRTNIGNIPLDVTETLGNMIQLRIDLFTLSLCTLSILIELSSNVKLQVHLERLGEATPFLLV